MKKIISLVLTLVMLFTVIAPSSSVFAANERTPIIYIRGNGEKLYYPDGTKLNATLEDLFADDNNESKLTKDVIVETAVNILIPFITEGMLFDKWDNYGKAIYDELSPLFPDSGLDENGNPQKGTGVSPEALANSEANSKSIWAYNAGQDYNFCYDWRLSPYDHVDRLHEYVQNVLHATGQKQVSIYARCFGGSLLNAYLEKYGHIKQVKNVMYSDVLSNETTVISKAFSGQVEFDAALIERYAGQLDYCGRYNMGIGFAFGDLLYEIVIKSMSFFNQVGATDGVLDGVENLYEKLYKALVPALCHATGIATQVNHWTCVAEEDMEDALNLIFGEEGSELRVKYAGLINKIQYYRSHVSKNLIGFYDNAKANGIHIGFFGKYGFMNAPFTVGADLLSDSLVSLKHATLGATCATIGHTLSEDYISQRVKEGKGKYISPDKQVDLSTAYSPETTWICKNAHHNIFSETKHILKAFLNGTNVTVNTPGMADQFLAYDTETNTLSTMTEDNSAEFDWIQSAVDEPTKETISISIIRWFTMLFKVIGMLLRGEISFGEAKEMF